LLLETGVFLLLMSLHIACNKNDISGLLLSRGQEKSEKFRTGSEEF